MKWFRELSATVRVTIASGLLALGIGAVAYGQGFTFNNILPGTSLGPSIAFNNDTTTGLYSPAAGDIGFTVAGSKQADVTANGLTYSASGGTFAQPCIPGSIGAVAYTSVGNATTNVAGKILWAACQVQRNMLVTNINILNGGTVGTDKGIAALYSSTGTLLANSALAGATTSGPNSFQAYALTAPLLITGPGRYFIAYQANGTTDNIRTFAASTFVDVLTASASGAFGTLTALTVPTTFTANIGPYAFLN
jgi:Domain of unknown function (DUF4082)